jgi:DNA modification methylase
MLYKGDNLELLKLLPEQHIDLIYCDILYGTGRNFEDYQDLKANRGIIEDFWNVLSELVIMKGIWLQISSWVVAQHVKLL